jgi:hypothetical protein
MTAGHGAPFEGAAAKNSIRFSGSALSGMKAGRIIC